MNVEQRKSFRIQLTEGREQGTLFLGPLPVDVRILDESAGGFAVALLHDEDVQQNQVLVLKTATGTFNTRVARIEQFDDGKLLGLMRLCDLTEAPKTQAQAPVWRDQLFEPPKPKYLARGLAVGFGAVIVVMLGCGLVAYRFWPAAAQQAAAGPVVESPEKQPAKPVRQEVKAQVKTTTEEAVPEESVAATPPATKKSKPAASAVRRPSKTSPEVLFRLHLDADQSRRIRQILSRLSGPEAEEEIRGVLTPEQASKWQKIAP